MRPCKFVRPLLLVLFAGVCPSLTGCFSGWAYPSVSLIPPVAFAPVTEEVRAFRVDVKDDVFWMDVGEYDRYELSEITGAERFVPQVKLAVDHGWYMINAVSFGQHTQYTLKVRLYRPGYWTVEISSWELYKPVEWQKADSLRDQEEAIDALVSTWETKAEFCRSQYWQEHPILEKRSRTRPIEAVVFDALAPGSTSQSHREALLFAAGEYERLRGPAFRAGERALDERLATKGAQLRELADQ